MASGNDIRLKYLQFFENRGHKIIPSAPLVPENDPTTLFTGSGMQPMIPYLLGQEHPLGNRLVNSQKCFRAQDIEEVGDNRHETFFEMLGNWSLGDYFKKDQLSWFYEFLTVELGLSKDKLFVSCFEGNSEISKDTEALDIWMSLGVPKDHVYFYGASKNWWARSSYADMPVGEPGGPDSEVFYDFGVNYKFHENSQWKDQKCQPNCDCGRFMEIGNNVFMTYLKTDSGFEPLKKKNIDFGGGLERLAAAVVGIPDIFQTDLYSKIIKEIEKFSNQKYADNTSHFRVISDHFKASAFLITDGIVPSNKGQGYFLRRLLRRSMVKLQQLGVSNHNYVDIINSILATYSQTSYFEKISLDKITQVVAEESEKFSKTLKDGLKKIDQVSPFDLFQTFGFPIELTEELYKERGLKLDRPKFDDEFQKHQALSRTAGKGMFKGGLADQSEITTKYHTATHLLHASLRKILGSHVQQKGSNITAERMRFDFSHPDRLTPEQIAQIENLVNQKISENIPVTRAEMNKSDALSQGALAFFPEKYPEITNVYKVGTFSMELCGGPHVSSTAEIGKLKIIKEESSGSGVRRIYAQLS